MRSSGGAPLPAEHCQSSTVPYVGAHAGRSVRIDPNRELHRLILLEDKLLRNPEARRKVHAQILDHARIVQEDWPRADLAEKLRAHAQWVKDNEEELRQRCRRGDFLLVIAGDGIDNGLMKLARRFAGKDDPLSLTELMLMSMALYSLGSEHLLIPHVVSAVQRSEREMTVRVIVQDVHGRELLADVVRDVRDEAEQASRGRLPVREEVAEFLRKAQVPLDAALLPAHPDLQRTARPRKSLEYGLTLDEDAGAVFKIHIGGYEKDVWSSIQVGLTLDTDDTAGRDARRRRIQALVDRSHRHADRHPRPAHGQPSTLNASTLCGQLCERIPPRLVAARNR